tara:strand:- start:3129 stop:5195 length:2067 start_codon:yes stop_codon:yes gene_type:complete
MAERVQTYRRQLRGLNIPEMDTSAQREQVRYYQTLSEQLNRMSSFFFKLAEGQAKIEGAEYGPANAPDAKQLSDAFSMPTGTADKDAARAKAIEGAQTDIGTALGSIGDTYSAFGRAARDSALTTTYNDLAVAAKRAIVDIKLLADKDPNNPAYAPDVVMSQYESIVSGYAGVFDDVNPAYARKFRAELNLYAYGELETITKKFNKENKNQLLAAFEIGFQQDLDGVSTWFEVGVPYQLDPVNNIYSRPTDDIVVNNTDMSGPEPTLNEGGRKRNIATKPMLDQILLQHQATAKSLGKSPEYIKQMETRWNTAVFDSAKGDVSRFISDYGRSNEMRVVGYNNLDNATFELKKGTMYKTTADGQPDSAFLALPKNIQNILQYYSKDDAALVDIKAAAKTQLAADLQIENAVESNRENTRKNSVDFYHRQIIELIVDNDINAVTKVNLIRAAGQNIMAIDSAKGMEVNAMLEDLVGPSFDMYGIDTNFKFQTLESNGRVFQEYDMDIKNDPQFMTTTHAKLLTSFRLGDLTYKDMQILSDKLAARQSVEGKEIMGRVRSALKMPANIILDQATINSANLALYGRIENRLAEAMKSQDFNAGAFMTEVLDIIQRGEDADGANLIVNLAARINLSGLGITFTEFQRNYQAEIAAPGTSETRKRELRELYEEVLSVKQTQSNQLNEHLPAFFQ